MNQECTSEEIPSKGQMIKDTQLILDISRSLHWFACIDKDLENHFALS
jgi:hypothetical protein